MRDNNETLIAADGVTVRFDGRAVLDGIDLAITRGEIVTLIGLNGSGKSTLVRALLGLLPVDGGSIRRMPGLRIGYTPQHINVDPTLPLTVARFLSLGARASRARIEAALGEVGAAHIVGAQVSRVSGGELHRVLLARALLREPDLLVLDEPMSGVDVAGQMELYRLISEIRGRYRCGVLLVSHDLHVVMAATDRVICLNHHICCTGRPQSVVRNPAFTALFGHGVSEVLALYSHHHDHSHDAAGAVIELGDAEAPDRERASHAG